MGWRFPIAVVPPALLTWLWLPSRLEINRVLWALGLVLQCALVVVVFRRRIARRFPCFTTLIGFYPLRASLLLVLAGRVDADVYNPLFNALTFTEIVLQIAVAGELIWRVDREMGGEEQGSMRRWGLTLVVLAGVAAVCTWLLLQFAPAGAGVDRFQAFAWFLMIAILLRALGSRRSANSALIAAGFGAFSLIQIAASLGRARAFLRHDAAWYLGWSYTPAVSYLALVLFWLIALRNETAARVKIFEVAQN
jgi:hypothetical protein